MVRELLLDDALSPPVIGGGQRIESAIMQHILRVVGSRTLGCGCLVGRYETYSGQCIELVDHVGTGCLRPEHRYASANGRLTGWFQRWRKTLLAHAER